MKIRTKMTKRTEIPKSFWKDLALKIRTPVPTICVGDLTAGCMQLRDPRSQAISNTTEQKSPPSAPWDSVFGDTILNSKSMKCLPRAEAILLELNLTRTAGSIPATTEETRVDSITSRVATTSRAFPNTVNYQTLMLSVTFRR